MLLESEMGAVAPIELEEFELGRLKSLQTEKIKQVISRIAEVRETCGARFRPFVRQGKVPHLVVSSKLRRRNQDQVVRSGRCEAL